MSRIERIIARNPFITVGAAIGCSLAFICVAATILYVAHAGKISRMKTCEAVIQLRDSSRSVLEDARAKDRNLDNRLFYNHSIRKLNKVECNA